MDLPVNYFWIPNYENRYAMKLDPVTGDLERAVYSLVSPGWQGKPAPMTARWSRNGMKISLTAARKSYKNTYSIAWLASSVRNTDAYKKAVAKPRPVTSRREPTPAPYKPKKVWMIGIMKDDGNISFSETPKQHTTREEAFKESEFLASVSPSQKFVIVETIRVVAASKLTITEYN